MIRFAHPYFLIIIPVIAGIIAWRAYAKRGQPASMLFSDTSAIRSFPVSLRARLSKLPAYLFSAALALFIVALARPQAGQKNEETSNPGIDIMLVMDTSTSMRALDFKPSNRLEAAKKVAKEFVKGRRYDRVGIVVFSGLAYTQCPLTADHEAVLNFLDQMEIGMTEVDGTAIGSAIATAANRLKDSTGKSKVMILITDGRNNMANIDPLTAVQAAAAVNIKAYTIGAGQPGGALYPVDDPMWGRQYVKMPGQELDEEALTKIADATRGRYFRATDTNSLASIFKQIDAMEKTEIKTVKYTSYRELYGYFLWPGLAFLLLMMLLEHTWLRRLP